MSYSVVEKGILVRDIKKVVYNFNQGSFIHCTPSTPSKVPPISMASKSVIPLTQRPPNLTNPVRKLWELDVVQMFPSLSRTKVEKAFLQINAVLAKLKRVRAKTGLWFAIHKKDKHIMSARAQMKTLQICHSRK